VKSRAQLAPDRVPPRPHADDAQRGEEDQGQEADRDLEEPFLWPTASKAPRKRRTLKKTLPPPPGAGWWGNGAPPWERWPGVTIATPSASGTRSGPSDGRSSAGGRVPAASTSSTRSTADKRRRVLSRVPLAPHGRVQGKAFVLLMPYQELLLTRPLFGWKRASDGTRRFRKLFVFLPKGAGKRPGAPAPRSISPSAMTSPRPRCISCAGDKEQARVVHNDAKVMIEDSQELDNMFEVLKDTIYRSRHAVEASRCCRRTRRRSTASGRTASSSTNSTRSRTAICSKRSRNRW
jgi:hypothetical protein